MLQRISRTFLVSGLGLLIVGCSFRGCGAGTTDIPPEEQLHTYITTAVNITKQDQKEDLVNLTTGDLKSALINASEDTFKRAYIDKKYDFRNFEIVTRKDDPGGKQTQIDFKIVYKSWSAGETAERAPVVDTLNRATLIYEYGQWSIAKVESLGSQFEWDVGLPMDEVSTKGVNPEDPPKEVESSRAVDDSQNVETNQAP
jgi:hypothetical protein